MSVCRFRTRRRPWPRPGAKKLLESLAEEDDALMERYLSGETVLPEMILPAVRKGTLARRLTPVLLGSALKNIGVQPVLDAVCDYLPSPVEAPPVQGIDAVTKSKKILESTVGAPLGCPCFQGKHGDGQTARVHAFVFRGAPSG